MFAVYTGNTNRRTFAAKLARALAIPVRTPDDRVGRPQKLINWGTSDGPEHMVVEEWAGNTPDMVGIMSHKIKMFDALANSDEQINYLRHTTDRGVAQGWLDAGYTVYERAVVQGHSGEGITVRVPGDGALVQDARLYTLGITSSFREYRVHVAFGEIICTQMKRKMSSAKMERDGITPDEATRMSIRTHANGWAFCVNNVIPLNQEAQDMVLAAMRACGDAQTGCVDILVTEDTNTPVVIELNSAPALRSPTVLEAYKNAFITSCMPTPAVTFDTPWGTTNG